jgi:hypothetical protein
MPGRVGHGTQRKRQRRIEHPLTIRTWVIGLESEEIHRELVGRIALIRLPIAAESDRLKYYAHVVPATVGYDEIVVRVHLFVGPDVTPPSWVVRIARNPSYVYTASFGHAFVLTGDTEGDGHQGEISALTGIRRSLLL